MQEEGLTVPVVHAHGPVERVRHDLLVHHLCPFTPTRLQICLRTSSHSCSSCLNRTEETQRRRRLHTLCPFTIPLSVWFLQPQPGQLSRLAAWL